MELFIVGLITSCASKAPTPAITEDFTKDFTLPNIQEFQRHFLTDIANIIRKIATEPAEQIEQFYKQILFNAMIGNTDDHLKNFSMLHNDAGWKLTPAYDLLPDIENRSEHVLDFGYTGPILCICDYKTAVKLIIN